MSWNISKSFFNLKYFLRVTSSGTLLSVLSQPLIDVDKLPSLRSSDCTSRGAYTAAVSTLPQPAISSIIPFTLDSKFTSSISLLISLVHFHLCWLSICVRWHVDLSLGNKKAAQLHSRLFVVQWLITSRLWEKGHDWLLIMMFILFMWWFVNWRATLCNYYMLMYVNWNWSHDIGDCL